MSEEERIADALKGVKPYIYEFYWDDEDGFLMEIWAEKEEVKRLLDEYRNSDPEGYNAIDWYHFLRSKGIRCRFIEVDYHIYF